MGGTDEAPLLTAAENYSKHCEWSEQWTINQNEVFVKDSE